MGVYRTIVLQYWTIGAISHDYYDELVHVVQCYCYGPDNMLSQLKELVYSLIAETL